MRLTTVIFIASLMQVSAAGYAQKITLSKTNVTLKALIKDLRRQSGYDFVYNDKVLNAAKPISVHVEDMDIAEVLDEIFINQSLTYSIDSKTVIIKEKEPSFLDKTKSVILNLVQDLIVRGKIIGENDQVLAGATVKVKGTNRISKSNEKGEFYLANVDEGAVLEISYIGFKVLEIPVKGAVMPLEIKLNVATGELEEVKVVYNTGYQELNKERATGAFGYVDNKLYNEQVATNLINRIGSIAGGLYTTRGTNGAAQITIRGLSTIRGPRTPLIVVDDFPYDGDINNINPNDVANITILKDAAAASIWGALAGNGVIVITTKMGKFNQQVKVQANTNVTIGEKPDLFALNQMSSSDFIDVEQFLFNNKNRFADTNNVRKPAFSPVYEILFKQRKGILSATDANSQIDVLRGLDVRNEYLDYFYQPSVNQQYAVNLNGGSSSMSWILSAGYDRNLTDVAARYNRITLRTENTYKPVKNMQVTAGIWYTKSNSSSGKPAYREIRNLFTPGTIPTYTLFSDNEGNALPLYNLYRQSYLDTVGMGKLLDWRYYPLTDYQHRKTTSDNQNLLFKAGLDYKLLSSLSLNVKYQYSKENSSGLIMNSLDSYFTRDLINTYSQLNRTTGAVKYIIPKGSIADINDRPNTFQNLRGQLNFSNTWSKHSVEALMGGELKENRGVITGYRNYGINESTLIMGNVDQTNSYPTFVTGSNSFIPGSNSKTATVIKAVSMFGNASYTYNNKYTLSASVRRDASNLFGVSINNKWKPLWSAGLMWALSKESFYKSEMIPELTVRATYGYSGNVDPSIAGVTTISYGASSPYTQVPSATIQRFPNPSLRWEQVGMFNIGLDFKIRNNRLTGSLDFYHKKADDLLASEPVDYTTVAAGSIVRNVGSMSGKGIDLQLNSLNINGDVKWITGFNLSWNKDKITKYFGISKNGNLYVGANRITGLEGRPVSSVLSYKWAGLDPLTGDPQGYLKGKVSKDYAAIMGDATQASDLIFSGSAIPTFFGSMGNTVSWYGFSVTARLVYKFGYYFRKSSLSYSDLFNNYNGHSEYALRWQESGDELNTNIPSMVYPAISARDNFYASSSANILKADHIRLEYINISYELRKRQGRNSPFENVNIFCVMNNLGLVWRANNSGIDPEADNILPLTKSISLGARINF